MDTSALAKCYVVEVGSGWITILTQPSVGNVIVIARLQRTKHIAPIAGIRLRANFLGHTRKEYLMVPINDVVIDRARDLVSKYPLRTLDATQLACAIEASIVLSETLTFISADNVLLSAAAGERFKTDNP